MSYLTHRTVLRQMSQSDRLMANLFKGQIHPKMKRLFLKTNWPDFAEINLV